jgi:hypothetical protein
MCGVLAAKALAAGERPVGIPGDERDDDIVEEYRLPAIDEEVELHALDGRHRASIGDRGPLLLTSRLFTGAVDRWAVGRRSILAVNE